MTNETWPEVLKTLLDRNASGYDRSRAFATFIADGKHLFYLDEIEQLLEEDNPSFRCEVVRALRRAPRKEYHALLGFALSDSDDYVVREALRGLTECRNPLIVATIERLVETGSISTRYEAERTLAAIRDSMPPRSPLPVVETVDEDEGMVKCKTEEVDLSMDILPGSAPIPFRRHLNRFERKQSRLNATGHEVV